MTSSENFPKRGIQEERAEKFTEILNFSGCISQLRFSIILAEHVVLSEARRIANDHIDPFGEILLSCGYSIETLERYLHYVIKPIVKDKFRNTRLTNLRNHGWYLSGNGTGEKLGRDLLRRQIVTDLLKIFGSFLPSLPYKQINDSTIISVLPTLRLFPEYKGTSLNVAFMGKVGERGIEYIPVLLNRHQKDILTVFLEEGFIDPRVIERWFPNRTESKAMLARHARAINSAFGRQILHPIPFRLSISGWSVDRTLSHRERMIANWIRINIEYERQGPYYIHNVTTEHDLVGEGRDIQLLSILAAPFEQIESICGPVPCDTYSKYPNVLVISYYNRASRRTFKVIIEITNKELKTVHCYYDFFKVGYSELRSQHQQLHVSDYVRCIQQIANKIKARGYSIFPGTGMTVEGHDDTYLVFPVPIA